MTDVPDIQSLTDPANAAPASEAPAAEGSAAASLRQSTPAEGAKPVRPEGLDDAFWDDESGVKIDDLLKDRSALAEKVRAADERRARVPEKADDYVATVGDDFELPEGISLPEGVSAKDFVNGQIDPDDPRIAAVRDLAHGAGLTQGEVSKLIGIGIKAELAAQGRVNTAVAAERGKLGENAGARVDAVFAGLKAAVGEDNMKALAPMLFSAKQVEAFEALLAKANASAPAFSPSGREDPNPPAVRSPAERMFPPENDPFRQGAK